jgi:hypothetical protein
MSVEMSLISGADHDAEQRRHEAAPAIAGPRRHDGGQAQGHRGDGEVEAVAEDREVRFDVEPDVTVERPGRGDDQRRHASRDEGQARQTMTHRIGRPNEHDVSAATLS